MSVVWWLALAVVSGIVSAEAVAWCAPLQRALLRRAAAALPQRHRARYQEEWYAELDALPKGPVTRLVFALSLVLQRRTLARSLGVPLPTRIFYPMAKRALDALTTVFLLLAVVPLFAVTAATIKLTSPGPVFYRQACIGGGGREFMLLKFRTMYVDHGPRSEPITPVGRVLRRYSLDELPQLLNVVRGQMSLVGPRAVLPDKYTEPGGSLQAIRLIEQGGLPAPSNVAKPGMTGLWQVSGRSDLTIDEHALLHRRYVEDWSLALDCLIIWKTVRAVMSFHER